MKSKKDIQILLDYIKEQDKIAIKKDSKKNEGWIRTAEDALLNNKKRNFCLELYVLNEHLNKNNLKLFQQNGELYCFKNVISHAKDKLDKKILIWVKYLPIHDEAFKDFFSLKYKDSNSDSDDFNLRYPKAVFALLNKHNFTVVHTEEKEINTRNPTKDEFREIALSIREETGQQQPQPDQIFDIWQTINNIILNDHQREELKYKYFKKK